MTKPTIFSLPTETRLAICSPFDDVGRFVVIFTRDGKLRSSHKGQSGAGVSDIAALNRSCKIIYFETKKLLYARLVSMILEPGKYDKPSEGLKEDIWRTLSQFQCLKFDYSIFPDPDDSILSEMRLTRNIIETLKRSTELRQFSIIPTLCATHRTLSDIKRG